MSLKNALWPPIRLPEPAVSSHPGMLKPIREIEPVVEEESTSFVDIVVYIVIAFGVLGGAVFQAYVDSTAPNRIKFNA